MLDELATVNEMAVRKLENERDARALLPEAYPCSTLCALKRYMWSTSPRRLAGTRRICRSLIASLI